MKFVHILLIIGVCSFFAVVIDHLNKHPIDPGTILTAYAGNQNMTQTVPTEEVLPVIGRVTIPFEGYGASTGFLVKDGDRYYIAPYDQGSSAANESYEPQFITRVTWTNGGVSYQPLIVDVFKKTAQ